MREIVLVVDSWQKYFLFSGIRLTLACKISGINDAMANGRPILPRIARDRRMARVVVERGINDTRDD